MQRNDPLVSVIITTKNEERNIQNCLESIKNQAYRNIEIIIVDNHSTDDTIKKIKELKIENFKLKIFQHGPERSSQRNYGVEKAKGKYILYLDADMSLSKNVIRDCVYELTHRNLVALYIPEIILGNSFFSKVRNFERSFYNGTVVDATRFIEKGIFMNVGGFDETMSGPEDWDLDKKIKRKGSIGIITSVLFHDESEFNLKKYLIKKKYYIKSFKTYTSKWGIDDPDIKRQFSPSYRMIFVFIEKGKWKKLIIHPILTLGMYLLRFLVGINYLLKK